MPNHAGDTEPSAPVLLRGDFTTYTPWPPVEAAVVPSARCPEAGPLGAGLPSRPLPLSPSMKQEGGLLLVHWGFGVSFFGVPQPQGTFGMLASPKALSPPWPLGAVPSKVAAGVGRVPPLKWCGIHQKLCEGIEINLGIISRAGGLL